MQLPSEKYVGWSQHTSSSSITSSLTWTRSGAWLCPWLCQLLSAPLSHLLHVEILDAWLSSWMWETRLLSGDRGTGQRGKGRIREMARLSLPGRGESQGTLPQGDHLLPVPWLRQWWSIRTALAIIRYGQHKDMRTGLWPWSVAYVGKLGVELPWNHGHWGLGF